MSWRCEYFESREAVLAKFGFVPIGAIYPTYPEWETRVANAVAPNYLRDWKRKRPPLTIKLPDCEFIIDSRAYTQERGYYGDGWTVIGTPPNLTITPSINIKGIYHGWLTAGVITDDCEGRKFPTARGLP